jgi:hypothetical protein
VITPDEAETMLEKMQAGKAEREAHIREKGYPSYTTQAGKLSRNLIVHALLFYDYYVSINTHIISNIDKKKVM